MDLKSQITSLVKLQELDSEIYSMNREKEAKPLEIKAFEAEFELKKQGLADLEKKLLDLQKQRKEKELELAANEESIKKLQGQLYSLKTNKEYQAMLQQIQDAKADASVVEDKILEFFEETDKLKKEIEQENLKLKEEENAFCGRKKQVELRLKEIDERLGELGAKRAQVLPGIEQKVLLQYERILHSRDGLAMAGVKDNSCSGCHMLVPAQVINLIKMYENFITCEVCNRILYIPE